VAGCLLACMAAGLLGGCAAAGGPTRVPTASAPRESSNAASGPTFTPVQRLIERGANLFLTDGCDSCHSISGGSGMGPSFARLNETPVELADGRRVTVDEPSLREALLDPASNRVKGYPAAPMLAVVRRLHLRAHPTDVAALAAFLQSLGPKGG
jgi:mono/diheme cytochrome c family protein